MERVLLLHRSPRSLCSLLVCHVQGFLCRCHPHCSIPACHGAAGEKRSRKCFLMKFVRVGSAINVKVLQQLHHAPPPLPAWPPPPPQHHKTLVVFFAKEGCCCVLGIPQTHLEDPQGAEGCRPLNGTQRAPRCWDAVGCVPMEAMRRAGAHPTDGRTLKSMGGGFCSSLCKGAEHPHGTKALGEEGQSFPLILHGCGVVFGDSTAVRLCGVGLEGLHGPFCCL